ncbi:hypothetical protein LVJ94_12390 [Pendulispora rubella]|uniref:Uncharacterized protein n=1 Tax=Pendulispora rubella TaxID=2741070 RepID=A0ABZ2LB82_9BACT
MQRLLSQLERISLDPAEVAAACRDAGVAFLETRRWNKRDLAEWLVESYQFATLRGHGGGVPKHQGTVAKETVTDLVDRVRNEVTDALDHILTGDPTFAEDCVRAGHVATLQIGNGRVMYVAMNHKSLRLSDRVLSLFAADYLMRPQDYRCRLSVCEYCRKVSFDKECVHPQSGVFAPGGRELAGESLPTHTIVVEEDEVEELGVDDIIVLESLAS